MIARQPWPRTVPADRVTCGYAAGPITALPSGTNLVLTASLVQVVSHSSSSGLPASVWVSLAALATSLLALSTSRVRNRRLLLQSIHESLTTIAQQEGRREIHRMAEDGRTVSDLTGDERAQCNNALGALNTMAIYYERRWVSRDALLQFWAEPVLKLMGPARPFLELRDAEHHLSGQIWPELRKFATAAWEYGRSKGWDLTGIEISPAARIAKEWHGTLAGG